MAQPDYLTLIPAALIGGFLPALVWLWFWLKEDRARPEPRRLIFRAFLAGAAAVMVALVVEHYVIQNFFGEVPSLNFNLTWSWPTVAYIGHNIKLFLVLAFIEEAIKLAFVSFAIFRNKNFDEPIDAMMYLITGAIGFAALENTLFLITTLLQGNNPMYFFLTGNLRFLGATILHIVSSAVVGSLIALSFCTPEKRKVEAAGLGLIAATLLHTLFNFFIIINEGRHTALVFAILWLAAIGLILLFEKVKRVTCDVLL